MSDHVAQPRGAAARSAGDGRRDRVDVRRVGKRTVWVHHAYPVGMLRWNRAHR